MVSARKSHFLEVFLPNLSSERLKIPSNFIKHLNGRTSGHISLTGPSGNSWHVDLIELNGHLYIDDGWPEFVRDHSIECGDSLVFGYDGSSDFTVQIFDQTSCEKEETFYAKCSQESSDLSGSLGNKREREEEVVCSSGFGKKKMRASWFPTHLDVEAVNKVKLESYWDENHEHKESFMNECDHSIQDLVEAFKRPILLALPAVSHDHILPILMSYHRRKNALKPKKACSKKKKDGVQKKTSISKFIEARAAHYFTSSFPYFVRVMKFSNINDRCTLKIPVVFSMEHLPDRKVRLTLRNLDGHYWMLNAVPTRRRNSRMHTFCGGWMAFIRDNRIKKDDVCIFELVDEFEMRVHILRLGLEGVDSEVLKSTTVNCAVTVESDALPLKSSEIVVRDNEIHPLKVLEPTMYENEEYDKVSEKIHGPGPQQEISSSSDTTDTAAELTSPGSTTPLSMSRTDYKTKDQLLRCNAEDAVYCQISRNSEANLHARCAIQVPVTGEDAGDVLSFTSPFPNFMKVMMSSNVGGAYSLAIPRKFSNEYLPSYNTNIVLRNLKGDCWHVSSRLYGLQTKFCRGWMSFVRENGVRVGDICVFELVDEGVLQVQIFHSQKRVQDCPTDDQLVDDSSTFIDSTQQTVMPVT